MNRIVLVITILFGYGFAQSGRAESSTFEQAEATVEIQYGGQVGSGIILLTSDPASGTATATPNSRATAQSTAFLVGAGTPLSSSTLFNTPPVFGTSRTQMINDTALSHYLFPTATGSSQIMPGTATQSLSEPNTSSPSPTLVSGPGIRLAITWSHVFFWAAIVFSFL
ncbi:uncharacterized protein K444DRAFT_634182 [Hyaloscypha bicolor E]|uniref:DOMON domain-containing protein n=1 Tax=Hyaloscypha bicolor E TaxID=1095630 RepID=A0A2J6SX47_9HELO|nr:uncharacterized protein K444DRAFT_634182 [Hyaloscypha bicolor E]PMD55349.1 hypothetical protein K444DRAFT_634182 [Hyaloscypha bicolor E]